MPRPTLILALMALVIVHACLATYQGAFAAKYVGTLTCTLTPSEKRWVLTAYAELSCHFDASAGADADFTGIVKRLGVQRERTGKLVLVWSVHARDRNIGRADLEGTYVGSLGGMQAPFVPGGAGLVGGERGHGHIETTHKTAKPPGRFGHLGLGAAAQANKSLMSRSAKLKDAVPDAIQPVRFRNIRRIWSPKA